MGKADKRNFRKMALESKLLKESNAFERGSHRPARLYETPPSAKNSGRPRTKPTGTRKNVDKIKRSNLPG
jgi:hypothetical protein